MPFQEKIVTFAKTLRTSLITLMEALLHYVWQHRLFPQTSLSTTQGEVVEVLDVGLHNTDAGPDFFNAKMRMWRFICDLPTGFAISTKLMHATTM